MKKQQNYEANYDDYIFIDDSDCEEAPKAAKEETFVVPKTPPKPFYCKISFMPAYDSIPNVTPGWKMATIPSENHGKKKHQRK